MATERSALLIIILWLTAVAAHAACLKTATCIVNAYIPVDHVNGPASCPYQSSSFTKIYKGDANRGT